MQGTNTYIVGTGKERLIIDTGQGYREWADLTESTCKAKGIKLVRILLSHWHGDHTKGVPDLIRIWPELSNATHKNSADRGQKSIDDGEKFHVEGATIRAVHAPGHSEDHMCFILEEESTMFTGDNILGHGSSAIEDLSTYTKGISTMEAQGCKIGFPAHGDVIPDLRAKISAELGLRRQRERRILSVLVDQRRGEQGHGGKGAMTTKEVVQKMHGQKLDPRVAALAIEPLTEEVLKKLAGDGKVAFQLRAGEKKWFAVSLTR